MGFDPSFEDTGPIDIVDIDAVVNTVRPQVRPTRFLSSPSLDEAAGARVRIASETGQHTGSFKFRAALSVALHTPALHLIAASSGNFGAALARAARETGKRCTIVMPAHSSKMKIEAVRSHGATVELVDLAVIGRKARVEELSALHPEAQVVSAYDDPYVIAGNATLGFEIFESGPPDCVVAPVGGGGLSSGVVTARDRLAPGCRVVGAEPLTANDAARSLRAGVLSHDEHESATLCDGARTLALGQRNFSILRRGMAGIVEVSDETVVRAMKLLAKTLELRVEPTGALALGALLEAPDQFRDQSIVCIVSGGNVDDDLYARLVG